MKGVRGIAIVAAVTTLGFSLSMPAPAGMYKWVDDKGVTHYGDRIPPEFKDKANTELSKRGITLRKTEQALTPEEIQAQQDQAERAKQEQARLTEQGRRDQALLQTFTTDKDIELKRDRDLQQIELGIANNQSVLKSTEKRLAEHQTRMDFLAKAGKAIPDGLKQDIENDENEKQRLEGLISHKRQEMEVVRAKYEDYKRRFRELQGAQSGSSTAPRAAAASPPLAPTR